MYRINISNITEEYDEDFPGFSEEQLLVPMGDWNFTSDKSCYLNVGTKTCAILYIKDIKKKFPTFNVALFEYKLTTKPIFYETKV